MKARADWRGVRVDWTLTEDSLVSCPRFYQSYHAGPDTLLSDLGDSEGVIARAADGSPQEGWFGPHYQLVLDDELWAYGEGHVHGNVFEGFKPRGTVDFRTLGLSYERHCLGVADVLGEFDGAVTTRREGEYEIVSAARDGRIATWYLRPDRGGLPERVTLSLNGEFLGESRTVLAQWDGHWYPQEVSYYRTDYKGGREPFETIVVDGVEVNPPELPERLSPAFIGIDAGVNLFVRQEGSSAPAQMFKWDGGMRVTLDEFNERCRAGELDVGPRFAANARRLNDLHEQKTATRPAPAAGEHDPQPNAAVAATETAAAARLEELTGWAAYTQRFIRDYALDGDQTQRALTLLKQCQEKGLAILRLREPSLRALDKEAQIPATERSRAERRRRLLGPFTQIFENELKPHLDRLPTRVQRERFESSKPRPSNAP